MENLNSEEGKMSKETLEEAAERFYPVNSTGGAMEMLSRHQLNNCLKQEGFIECAKWMQERMYSEAIEFAEWIRIKDFQTTERDNWIGLDLRHYTTKELFEQFKKEIEKI